MGKSDQHEWEALRRPPRLSSPDIVPTFAAPPSRAPTAPLPPADREVQADRGTLRLISVADDAMSAPRSIPAPTQIAPRPPANSSTEGGSWALEMTGSALAPPPSSSSPFGSARLGSTFFAIGLLATLLGFGATQLFGSGAAKRPSTGVKSAVAAAPAPAPVDDVGPPATATRMKPAATSIPAVTAPPPVAPSPSGAKFAPTPATARASAARTTTTPKPASPGARPKTMDLKTTDEILREIGAEQLRR